MAKELEPLWARFPNVIAVRVQRMNSADKDARPVAMILEMGFPDMAAIDASLNSSIKTQSHAAIESVMELFDERFYHFIAEAKALHP